MAVILFLIIVFLVVAIFFMFHRHIKMLDKLDKMIDSAVENNFLESDFNESRLSKIESKMYRYLSVGETSLAETNSEKDAIKTLISDISHQTKTPISNIMLYSELLCDENDLDEKTKRFALHIKSQAEKLNFLITSLIKISRLENGILSLSPKENNVGKLLSEIDYDNKARLKNIDLEIERNIDITAVFDLKWTAEALSNIVDNAIKYTPPGGGVVVFAVSYDMFVKIDIKDNGIGIREEDYSKIFARFCRLNDVRDEAGVGIGLYLAREIISKQGGYIKVSSEVGKGSTFSVFIPKNANMSKK